MTIPSEEHILQENITFDSDYNRFLRQLNEVYAKIAYTSNAKDIGSYEEFEVLNGQKFFGANPQTKREVFRKCFPLGAIAAGGNAPVTHGIVGITQITRLYGSCITNIPDNRPIPFADVTAVTNQISILLNGANIIVFNGATAPNITSGIIVVECLKV